MRCSTGSGGGVGSTSGEDVSCTWWVPAEMEAAGTPAGTWESARSRGSRPYRPRCTWWM